MTTPCRLSVLGVVAAGITLSAGCYQYVPVPPSSPEPGSVVRVGVNDRAAPDLTSVLGPGVLRLNGRLLERDQQTVSILVESYQTLRNGNLSGVSDPVRLTVDQITDVEQKRLARGRSVLLGIAFVGGALALTEIFGGGERVLEREDPDDPGPLERRSPRRPWIGVRMPFR